MSGSERVTLRSAYLYLVCLVTLVIAIFAAVDTVRSAVELAYPEPSHHVLEPPHGKEGEQESAQERERREQAAQDAQRRWAVLGLVRSGSMLLISVPVYAYHWRRVQDERSPSSAGVGESVSG
jgi:hypothetical protein